MQRFLHLAGLLSCLSLAAAASDKPVDTIVSGIAQSPLAQDPIVHIPDISFEFLGTPPPPIQGTLGGVDPTYNRQTQDCGGPSQIGTDVFYETVTITNTVDAPVRFDAFTSNQDSPTTCSIDSFLSVYEAPFNPGNSSARCVDSDDDGGPSQCSRVAITVNPGETAVIVTSTYENGGFSPYQLNIDASVHFSSPLSPLLGELTAEDAVYNRQAGDCAGLSGIGTAVFFDTVGLENHTGINTTFELTTSDSGDPLLCTAGDTFLSVYDPVLDPANPVLNCLTSNDDGGPGVCSRVTFSVAPEKRVVIVVTSFGNGSIFPYQVNLTAIEIFLDGFETGDLSAWSASVP